MSRVDVLAELADRYAELVDPLASRSGVAGDGGSLPLPPPTYTGSVREFERLMVAMRLEARPLWTHVMAWHIDVMHTARWLCGTCDRMTHEEVHRHRDRQGRPYEVTGRRVVFTVRHPAANERRAREGLGWMAERWGLDHEPMLPRELTVMAAA